MPNIKCSSSSSHKNILNEDKQINESYRAITFIFHVILQKKFTFKNVM